MSAADQLVHPGLVDEWVFAAWQPDASAGVVSGHRLLAGGRQAWYWAAVVEADRPLLHLGEYDIVVRAADPFIVKAPEMWAEHQLDAEMEQWSIGNEAYFVALDDAEDALGRAYGTRTALATDLEWYAIGAPTSIDSGYEQRGVAHGVIERLHRPDLEFTEAPAHRWRRWGPTLGPLTLPVARGRSALRAPFAFPDNTCVDWVLGVDGWASREVNS